MKKKVLALLLASVLTAGILSACSNANSGSGEQSTSGGGNTTIKVAASATPHAEILEQVKPLLKEKGYDLEVTVFNDYVQPNEAVESG